MRRKLRSEHSDAMRTANVAALYLCVTLSLVCGCQTRNEAKKLSLPTVNSIEEQKKAEQKAFDSMFNSQTILNYKAETTNTLKQLALNVSLEDLQHWATNTIKAYLNDSSKAPVQIRKLDWPEWTKKVNEQTPLAFSCVRDDNPANSYISIVWGGGWGGFGGLLIGGENFRPVTESSSNFYLEWHPGIYAWHDTH